MDQKFAELISLYRYAENALIIERNYFEAKSQDPFITSAARLEAMAFMTQLDSFLQQLRFDKDNLIAAHQNGVFPPPSQELLKKARDITKKLGEELQNANTAKAVVLAAADFLALIGGLAPTPVPLAN
jgi:hypothetical protein